MFSNTLNIKMLFFHLLISKICENILTYISSGILNNCVELAEIECYKLDKSYCSVLQEYHFVVCVFSKCIQI